MQVFVSIGVTLQGAKSRRSLGFKWERKFAKMFMKID